MSCEGKGTFYGNYNKCTVCDGEGGVDSWGDKCKYPGGMSCKKCKGCKGKGRQ